MNRIFNNGKVYDVWSCLNDKLMDASEMTF